MTHTKGTWRVRFLGGEDTGDNGFFVEAENELKPELGYGIEIMMEDFGDHNGYPREQRLADAKLIAASPDLLEACIEFVRKVESGEAKSTKSYQQMKAAISKATL